MTGIIHFSDLDRVEPRLSRRAMIAGATGAAITALRHRASAQTPAAMDATPVGSTQGETYRADARDRLLDMLSRLPSSMVSTQPGAIDLFSWVDLQTQLSTLGVNDPLSEDAPIVAATRPLMSTDPLITYSLAPEVRDALGFSALEVHQILTAGVAPDWVTIYSGGVAFAELGATWEAAGYEHKTAEWGDYWTLGENGEVDPQLGVPLGIGPLNNIALLEDDTIVVAGTLDLVASVMTLRDADDATAAGDEDLNTLIDAMPIDTVNALAFTGEAFRADTIVPENPGMDSFTTVSELLAESDAAVGPMPQLHLALCGVTAGAMTPDMAQGGGTPAVEGNLDAIAFMSFLAGSEGDAAAAAEVAYWRLENMTSPTTGFVYSDVFVPSRPVEDAVDGTIMTVVFGAEVATFSGPASMIMSRDVWPFAWLPEQE
jgi:hypothetical protein